MSKEIAIKRVQQLMELLKIEKDEDIALFNRKILQVSLHQRTQAGTTWYPLELKEIGYGLGEQPFVVLEKNQEKIERHQFRAGKIVNLFSNMAAVENPHVKGIINYAHRNTVKVFLYANDHPDWIDMGKIGLDLLFDDRSYKEMEKAIQNVLEAEKGRLADWRDILKGGKSIEFEKIKKPYFISLLNDSQNEAINKIVAAEDLAVVHGPPGTGKTTTIVEAIQILAQEGGSILATAPSNTAVDLLTLKLSQKGLNVIRIGNISRIDPALLDLTLEKNLYDSNEAKEIKRMKNQADQYRKMASKYKRKFGPEEREQRRMLYREARELRNQIQIIESYLVNKILEEADVITATLVGSNNRYLQGKRFKTVVIDEAAQALEPATWIPIAKADEKLVLAGDPFQLPPTVKSRKAAKEGLETTLIEQCLERFPNEVSLLDTQYRMHETIMGFSNQYFYKNALKADDSVRYQKLHLLDGEQLTLEFIDTAGCGFDEKQNPKSLSLYNPEEYGILWRHLDKLISMITPENSPSIGIISPYREQVLYIREQVNDFFDDASHIQMDINTIDSFQGQERDVIYISLVRSNEKGEIGFLKDYRRMNVAMTRARKKLVVIGDSATLGKDPFYEAFLEYCEKQEAYKSAWEFMY